ncbi:hypothetical protein RhiirA1_458063 [Rhizophagus irregularis]|uniref:Uncharacterized protein n=1 Tax=Rhizophagus irregularis TaxID=588596 RepID=A0A2I1ECE7_9GLOM|nr:hypothetical protein RhiirA1_458063 [Rhizophagus irregularis]PKY19789.1 hypothetical protein RhiirB3_432936 [Rhizophagus irregularis]CAB4486026.1 unnamed protein product [Rhizophagus irregularis]CAB5387199.1 unnamed protein product [Rhizophagus irregularis]
MIQIILYVCPNFFIIDKKYNPNLKLEYIDLIIEVFSYVNEDSPLKRNNIKLFCLRHFHYDAVLNSTIVSSKIIYQESRNRSQQNLFSISVRPNEHNNKDTTDLMEKLPPQQTTNNPLIDLMEKLPPQQTTNNPLIDQFYNGSSFN